MRVLVLLGGVVGSLLLSSAAAQERRTFEVLRSSERIDIDGDLKEDTWQQAKPVELRWETSPGNNIPAPVKTEVWLAHDEKHLYIAFRAWDPEPERIRAHHSDRDDAVLDDFVGIIVDPFNDQRRGFEFFSNALGVQIDAVNNDVGGGEDLTWDAIWDSAGRITATGYEVEIAIPFSSLRFRSSEVAQVWGVDLVRIYPRDQRRRLGLHPLSKDRNCYLCQASAMTGFGGMDPGLNLELDPTLTGNRTERREAFPLGALAGEGVEVEPGLTARWGMTPNLTLTGTLNPDFSQVEADEAQLEVNRQFTLFFEEKRQFFLEGADFFTTPLPAVYTRTVSDPDWGLKLTGKQGRSAVGLFVAEDVVTNVVIPGAEASALTSIEESHRSSVLRYRADIGRNSTVGLLLTDRSAESYQNTVGGIDGYFRITPRDTIRAQFLRSRSKYPDALAIAFAQPQDSFEGEASTLAYRHSTRIWTWNAEYEDVGTDFRADSGFMPKVDYRLARAGLERTWWADQKKTWYTRYAIGGDWDRAERQDGQLLEEELEVRGTLFGPLQSILVLVLGTRDRFFNGVTFHEDFLGWHAEFQPTGDFYVALDGGAGDQIDFSNTRLGRLLQVVPLVSYRAGRNLQLELRHHFERLDVEGGRLYEANLSQLRTIYHFNLRTFVRLVLQFTEVARDAALYEAPVDTRTRQLLPQLLFSYKVNPQTVFFAGYSETRLGNQFHDLRERDRTMFVKLGYAWLP
jgi:hypothetical protein